MSSHFDSGHMAAAHFESSHFGRGLFVPPVVPPFTPEPVLPPGGQNIDAQWKKFIEEEDEMLMLVIRAFLTMRNRR